MNIKKSVAIVTVVLGASGAVAEDSALVLGKSSFNARCAVCHGENGKGDGSVAGLFQVPPADLTKLSERAGGAFPFSATYQSIATGLSQMGHGNSEMPVWGDYFLADTLEDRGLSASDVTQIVQGRILSLVYYLQSIQE